MLGTVIAIQTAGLAASLKQSVAAAASLRAEAIEIDARAELRPGQLTQTALRQFRKLLADERLGMAAVRFQTRRGYDVAEGLQRRVEATQDAMRMAAQLGAPVVVNRVAALGEDQQGRAWEMLVEVLTDLGRLGQRLGVRLAAQTGWEPGPRLASLLAALPEGSLAVALDPGALVMAGYSIEEALKALGLQVAHVYATDAMPGVAGRGTVAAIGEGSVDYPSLLAALAEYDYRGAISLGYHGMSPSREALLAEVKKLRQWLRRG